jgi:hypothetical protein
MPEVIDRKSEKPSSTAGRILQRRFFLLFLFLLVSLALYPFAETSPSIYIAFRVTGSAVILLSVYAVGFRRSLVILGLVLAVPRLAQHILDLRIDTGTLATLSIVLSFAFDTFIIIVMFRRIFSRESPTAETIFGALSIYVLIGYSFASVYRMVATLQPNAFYLNPITNTHTAPNRFDFIFYSFGTMTALGAPGITAVSNQARALTVIQAMLGIFYLAVLIARLMAGYRARALEQQSR